MFKMIFTQEVALAILAWFIAGCVISTVLGPIVASITGGIIMFTLTTLAFDCYTPASTEEGTLS